MITNLYEDEYSFFKSQINRLNNIISKRIQNQRNSIVVIAVEKVDGVINTFIKGNNEKKCKKCEKFVLKNKIRN
ncbi:hypothetical protein BHE89_11400 [Shigella sp. FC1967]|nr:hypothetical protein BHE89_11400 [Shigella sp. FC1967]